MTIQHEVLQRNEEGMYNTYAEGSAIFRNGLLQVPGIDYATGDGYVVPVEPWAFGDIVTMLKVV